MSLCAFNGTLHGIAWRDEQLGRQGRGADKGITFVIIESATREFVLWLGRSHFNSFYFPSRSFTVLLNQTGISQGEILHESPNVRRHCVHWSDWRKVEAFSGVQGETFSLVKKHSNTRVGKVSSIIVVVFIYCHGCLALLSMFLYLHGGRSAIHGEVHYTYPYILDDDEFSYHWILVGLLRQHQPTKLCLQIAK